MHYAELFDTDVKKVGLDLRLDKRRFEANLGTQSRLLVSYAKLIRRRESGERPRYFISGYAQDGHDVWDILEAAGIRFYKSGDVVLEIR
jgi:hypothetical protein